MFSDHPATPVAHGGAACVVANDLGRLTEDAAAFGPNLHVLLCQPGRTRTLAGVTIHRLDDCCPAEAPNVHGPCPSDLSDRVRRALERLHDRYNFATVVFPVRRGLGFRAIQARDGGLSFRGVTLTARLDGCAAWERDRAGRWSSGLDELELDYLERCSFERADVRIADNTDLLNYVYANGWSVAEKVVAGEPTNAEPHVTVCVPHYNLGRYLPRTLESLAVQTYPRLDVLVIDDGSTEEASRTVFAQQRERFPQFRFLTQPNAGIGATRNRGLTEAIGEYFIPMDADNVARPELVARLVAGIHHRPDLAALTCYFLAFADDSDLDRGRYRYAYRPTGGPRVLASLRNVYGDATAIYRTDAFRSVGGYETDRGTSFEDWEAFVKLAQAGFGIDVLPEVLFYYRHREEGFSRVTRQYANHERVLRRFRQEERLPVAERIALWNALIGFHRTMDSLSARSRGLRHRLADGVLAACRRVPFVVPTLKWLLRPVARAAPPEQIPLGERTPPW
jgi:glycosyltransferase involved in cell wall biosynthesis